MAKHGLNSRLREKRTSTTIVVVSARTGKEINAVILGSMGHAPAKERMPLPVTANFIRVHAYAGAAR